MARSRRMISAADRTSSAVSGSSGCMPHPLPRRACPILKPVADLDRWIRGTFTAEGVTHPTYRRGNGPGVIVVHELPGITPEVVAFADEVVDAGFTVVLPHLFGTPGAPLNVRTIATTLPRVCVNREFNKLAVGQDVTGGDLAAGAGPRPARRARRGRRRRAGDVLHRRVRAGHDGRSGGRGAGRRPAVAALPDRQGPRRRPQPLPRRPGRGQGPGRGRLPRPRRQVRRAMPVPGPGSTGWTASSARPSVGSSWRARATPR